MEIFDTHTHLNADDFAGREAEELALAKEMGVTRHNVVGFDAPTIKRAIELAEKYPEIYATIGWHPTEAGSYTQEIEDMIVANNIGGVRRNMYSFFFHQCSSFLICFIIAITFFKNGATKKITF